MNEACNKKLSKKDFFFCFDIRLATYLNSRGMNYIINATHKKSNNEFYLYLRTKELTELLDNFHKRS